MIHIRKNAQAYLLALCVLVLLFNSYELTFAIWSFTALVTMRKTYSVKIIEFVLVLMLILLIAFVSSFFNKFKWYNFYRDIAYLLKPILGLLIGYNVCRKVGTKTIYWIVNTGFILAIVHILTLGLSYTVFGIRDLNQIRSIGGYFNDFEIYVLILLIFSKNFNLNLSVQRRLLFIAIIAFSSFLYFARTNIMQFIILFLGMKGFYKVTRKGIALTFSAVVLVLLSYAAIYYSYPHRNGPGLETLLYKIKIAPIESLKTKIDQDDWKDFNDNYRSFENIITVKQVSNDGTRTMLLGKGLGSTIDLGRDVWSNDGEFIRHIPELHNAYMTVYLKSGLLGVFLTLFFIYLFFKNRKTSDYEVTQVNNLILGSAIFLIFSNWVFMGLYLKLDNKSIFYGFLFAYKALLISQNSQELSINDDDK